MKEKWYVMPLTDNDRWLLSYYRSSEINAALFFERVFPLVPPGRLQVRVARHFADEAGHARHWNECLNDLDAYPVKLRDSHQDRYLEAVGMPGSLMGVMAVTQVLERRVIGQYRGHLRAPGLHPLVRQTLERITLDERWHLKYVREALAEMAPRFGVEHIESTIKRFAEADEEVCAETLTEYGERMAFLNIPNGALISD